MKHISKSKSTIKLSIKNKNEIPNETINIKGNQISISITNNDGNNRNNKKLSSVSKKIYIIL